MAILVGIDGTGSDVIPSASRDAQYDIDFADSFVRRIAGRGGANTKYLRGPVMLGGGLVDAVRNGARFIKERRNAGAAGPVLLTGYSRGAAGAVAIAKRLQRDDIYVDAMMLFDCVDRHLVIDAEIIPRNVRLVKHVIRDPRSGSRESFSNDGMRYYPQSTVYPTAIQYMCTHGGMGGCPWKQPNGVAGTTLINEGGVDGKTNISYDDDKRVSARIWNDLSGFLRTHKFL
ncbi:MAG: hypothetical protein ACK5NT_15905 [Pyrinomonadaceae bacterium]